MSAKMVLVGLFGVSALNTSTSASLCGGGAVVDASSDWVWSHEAVPSPSCTSPAVQNVAKMCSGDPTSVVIQGDGQPQCLSAQMSDCRFNMHDIDQLDFDVDMVGCGGTWAAPLWMTPDHWAGGGASGEIDMVENCPSTSVNNNFAGGGTQVKTSADPNSWRGHTTMWKQADSDGVQSIHVQSCDPSASSCSEGGDVAYLRDIYGLNGCRGGENCMYTMVSDIWNGNSGDGGYSGCAGGKPHYSTGCSISVTNIRFKAAEGTFTGKCAALLGSSPTPSPTPTPTPTSCTEQGQDPFSSGSEVKCCSGFYEDLQNWDGDGRFYYRCVATFVV